MHTAQNNLKIYFEQEKGIKKQVELIMVRCRYWGRQDGVNVEDSQDLHSSRAHFTVVVQVVVIGSVSIDSILLLFSTFFFLVSSPLPQVEIRIIRENGGAQRDEKEMNEKLVFSMPNKRVGWSFSRAHLSHSRALKSFVQRFISKDILLQQPGIRRHCHFAVSLARARVEWKYGKIV